MKKVLSLVFFFFVGFSLTGLAQEKMYRIEFLQVTAIDLFNSSYTGFVHELEKNGLILGKNLEINRTIIDFDVEKGGLWKKVGVLMRIKSEASRIVDDKPDLVLTMGTPATKYAKNKIIAAGIPLVFSSVSIPTAAGCKSMTEAGPGFTGSTTHMDMKNALTIVKLAFPQIKTIGIIHTDDDNGTAHVEEAKKQSVSAGLTILTKEVDKNDPITPAAQDLIGQGIQAFIVPLDTYYGLWDNKAGRELALVCESANIPMISLVLYKMPGAILYEGSDYEVAGAMAAGQVVQILKNNVKPESLPIASQSDLNIMVDTNVMKKLNIQLPMEILQIAKSVE